MNPSNEKVVFLHIGKTAGSWLRAQLWWHFRERSCPYIFPEEFTDIDAARRDYDLFGAHIGFTMATWLGNRYITLLRQPVDRFISTYYYWRHVDSTEGGPGLAKSMSLDEFISARDEPIVSDLHNCQAWQIAHSHKQRERFNISEDTLFERAAANLNQFSAVGVTESIPDFALALDESLSIKIDGSADRANVTQARPVASNIDFATRRKIADLNTVDQALYEYVTRQIVMPRVNRRLAAKTHAPSP